MVLNSKSESFSTEKNINSILHGRNREARKTKSNTPIIYRVRIKTHGD